MNNSPQKIIIDFDCTFGAKNCDVDDGLALIYTLGNENAELIGLTTTFGNSDIKTVDNCTKKLIEDLKLTYLPFHSGGELSDQGVNSQASVFLARMSEKYKGELNILTLGSLTNLYQASVINRNFFKNINKIVMMGGITEPLIVNGLQLDELNFSCDPKASLSVIGSESHINIVTANRCTQAFFPKEKNDMLKKSGIEGLRWLSKKIRYWYEREKNIFGHDGIYKWDVYAAAVLINPQLFAFKKKTVTPSLHSLKTGCLNGNGTPAEIMIPRLNNPELFIDHVYDTYTDFFKKNDLIKHSMQNYSKSGG